MDGTSVTIVRINGSFHVCGHNYEYADDGKCSFWEWAKKVDLERKLADAHIDNVAIQGEFCGAGIQLNPLKLQRPDWYVFTVNDLVNNKRLGLHEMRAFCEKLGLTMVPVEEENGCFAYETVEEILDRARGAYPNGGPKEGIVVRPAEPTYSSTISAPLSMKAINNDYLLKKAAPK